MSTLKTANTEAKNLVDNDGAVDFLKDHHPGGAWHLVELTDRLMGRTFTGSQVDEMREWIAKRNGHSNLYFHVNPLKHPPKNGKADKEEVRPSIIWLHTDLDADAPSPETFGTAKAELVKRLTAANLAKLSVPLPTKVADTGGGYHVYWKLTEPVSPEVAEGMMRWLAQQLGGDPAVCEVSRILRIPGTANLPNETKRKKGRTGPLPSGVVGGGTGNPVAPSRFKQIAKPGGVAKAKGKAALVNIEARKLRDIAELEQWDVPPLCKQVILHGHDPEDPNRWNGDRSDAVWHVVCELVRREVPDDLICGILLDETLPISAHVLAQKKTGARKYALAQIAKAHNETAKAASPAAEAGFITNEKGMPIKDVRNVRVALSKLGVTMRYDLMADRYIVAGLEGFDGELTDAAVTRMRMRAVDKWSFWIAIETFREAVTDLARESSFHPVRDYLDGITWDGVPRLDTWLTAYLGAPSTELNRAVGAITLIAAVRRVRQPGCKFDEMLVLEGPQGLGKSKSLGLLAGNTDLFTASLRLDMDEKTVIEQTAGKWLVECGELDGLSKTDSAKLKALLSRGKDRARLAYGRSAQDVPRQWIVIGTTNTNKYLIDPTGNRRVWPVVTSTIDVAAIERDRDMIWAEAAAREAAGESIRLDPSLYEAARLVQEERLEESPLTGDLEHHLGSTAPGWIASVDAWRLAGKQPGTKRKSDLADFGAAMRKLGFKNEDPGQFKYDQKNIRGWWRGNIGNAQTSRIKVEYSAFTGVVTGVTFPDEQLGFSDTEWDLYGAEAGAGFELIEREMAEWLH